MSVMIDVQIASLLEGYRTGAFQPSDICLALAEQARAYQAQNPIWTYVLSDTEIERYLEALSGQDSESLPLYGIPFAIKDNIDLAGVVTTAGCRAYGYQAEESAVVVERLIAAGAIPIGKTVLDQFATGLVGTRLDGKKVINPFSPNIVPGGSSTGSGVAVAEGLVSFALGTDTAGSGRVPATLTNIVGLKPSRGLLSTSGVVPACRSLDCVSIFTRGVECAERVLETAAAYDPSDAYSRHAKAESPTKAKLDEQIFGIPDEASLQWFGDESYETEWQRLKGQLIRLGVTLKPVDVTPFIKVGKLLYEGPWLAERVHAVGEFVQAHADQMDPVVADIIGNHIPQNAVQVFDAQYRLQALKQQANQIMAGVDALVMPTIGHPVSFKEIEAEPIAANAQMGHYTNFMNLFDMMGVALPFSVTAAGIPFGWTLVGEAFSEQRLLQIASLYQHSLSLTLGHTALKLSMNTQADISTIDLVVCGAHLEGLALNWQLVEREAILVEATQSAPHYRFYALAGGPPFRPGMVRDEVNGAAIEVEVWRVPEEAFGSFVAGIPYPLGIGKVQLADGRWESGFMCEAAGLEGATDITHLASWRRYLSEKEAAVETAASPAEVD